MRNIQTFVLDNFHILMYLDVSYLESVICYKFSAILLFLSLLRIYILQDPTVIRSINESLSW